MPFKHPNGTYYCEIKIEGYGKLKRMSLGTTRKRDARLMEEALRDLGRAALVRPRLTRLLDAVQPQGRGKRGEISPADILRAKNERGERAGRGDGYERLLRSLNDPPLPDVLDAYAEHADPTRAEGFADETLREYAGAETYSYLLDAGRVQSLLEEIEEGEEKKRSTVCRLEKRLISKLIRWKSGGHERDRVFADVEYAPGDDTRRVRFSVVTTEALRRLVNELQEGYWKAGDELAPVFARTAITTGCTIGPLSRLTNGDLSEEKHDGERWGRVQLRGTKEIDTPAGNRDRPILILPSIWKKMRVTWEPSAPDKDAFPLEYTRFYTIWKKAVARAGLEAAVYAPDGSTSRLRPHDLRAVFSHRAEAAGVQRSTISSAGLGHSDPGTTDRYLSNESAISREEMRRIGGLA